MCTATAATIADTAVTPPVACPKCATNNAGKLTCCARGGSWFQKCGDTGDSKFDHTWTEGIKACKDSTSGKAQAQAQAQPMMSNQTTTAQEQKAVQQKITDSVTDNMNDVYNAGAVNFKVGDKHSTFAVTISLFLTMILLLYS